MIIMIMKVGGTPISFVEHQFLFNTLLVHGTSKSMTIAPYPTIISKFEYPTDLGREKTSHSCLQLNLALNVGKGSNIIISMLHHFLNTHGFGETSVHFHADNCSGQKRTDI